MAEPLVEPNVPLMRKVITGGEIWTSPGVVQDSDE